LFKKKHHQNIELVLKSLDSSVLEKHQCYFGGGSAISLRYGEFRESADIDFLVSDRDGYRALRLLLTGRKGIQSIAIKGSVLVSSREVRADQYGIRTMVNAGGEDLKFEIIHEGRIELDQPEIPARIVGISTLSEVDLAASKMLANSDRWADRATFCRDVIDLSMLPLEPAQCAVALEKARRAYGESIDRDLTKALEQLLTKPEHFERCVSGMKMGASKVLLKRRLVRLQKLLNRQAK
jgi:hypothetical protein